MMLGKFNSEKKFIDQIKKSKYVIIYGAGMVGELIYNRILRYGLDKKVIGFAVTQKQENKEIMLPVLLFIYHFVFCLICF